MASWAWGQFALVFWAAVCLFAAGARGRGLQMNRRTCVEILQGAVIVVLLFGLASEGRGCRGAAGAPDALCVGDTHC